MPHKAGGKITSSHSTLIDLAVKLVDYIEGIDDVTKISLGPMDPVHGRASPEWVVKILDDKACILLQATQKGTTQAIRVTRLIAKIPNWRLPGLLEIVTGD